MLEVYSRSFGTWQWGAWGNRSHRDLWHGGWGEGGVWGCTGGYWGGRGSDWRILFQTWGVLPRFTCRFHLRRQKKNKCLGNVWLTLYREILEKIVCSVLYICTFSVRSTVAGETVLRLELCCRVSRRGRGNEWGSATWNTPKKPQSSIWIMLTSTTVRPRRDLFKLKRNLYNILCQCKDVYSHLPPNSLQFCSLL